MYAFEMLTSLFIKHNPQEVSGEVRRKRSELSDEDRYQCSNFDYKTGVDLSFIRRANELDVEGKHRSKRTSWCVYRNAKVWFL